MAKEWAEMTSEEKQEANLAKWASGEGIKFASPEAKEAYTERATRLKDAIQLKKRPDRVPVFLIDGFYPAAYAGFTPQEVMYDYEKCAAAWKKFRLDFATDGNIGPWVPGAGKFYDILDYKQYSWPGHGVAPEYSYQCNEGEYMKEDEYDSFIEDPSRWYSTALLPRVYSALQGYTSLGLTDVLEMYGAALNFIPFGLPPVQAVYQKLFEAGAEALKYAGAMGAHIAEMAAAGFPLFWDGPAKAPFDMFGDTLRGTRGIMVDMYRQPDKLLKAMDVMAPLVVKNSLASVASSGVPIVVFVMHKGADGFLSDAQYKKFYWPPLRKVMMSLIEEGIVSFMFIEGGYNTRLEVIKDLPKGKAVYWLDRTDMVKAKKILGDVGCIGGNVPPDMLAVGTPEQVKDYAKNLIDTVGKGGGFILGNGTVIEQAKPENIHAIVDAAREYGVYK